MEYLVICSQKSEPRASSYSKKPEARELMQRNLKTKVPLGEKNMYPIPRIQSSNSEKIGRKPAFLQLIRRQLIRFSEGFSFKTFY